MATVGGGIMNRGGRQDYVQDPVFLLVDAWCVLRKKKASCLVG